MAYLAAIISGLLAAASFPTIVTGYHFPDLHALAWVALIPFFLYLRTAGTRKAIALTILFGSVWNGLTSYWIFSALYFNGQLSVTASLGVLLFMACVMGVIQSVFLTAGIETTRRWRLPWLLTLPAAWTLFEWVRNYWPFGGYPWSNLGYSQGTWLAILQIADLVGVFGISFLIVLVNAALSELIAAKRQGLRMPWRKVMAVGVLLFSAWVYGKIRLPQIESEIAASDTLKVALLQPNIGQQMKWKVDLNQYIENTLVKMTAQAMAQGIDFVVWPETSLPTALPLSLSSYPPLNAFTVPVLLGILSTDPVPGKSQPLLYNSALQVAPGGRFVGRQHKQHLVPLGEYIPLQNLLWFVSPIVPKIGDFRTELPTELLKVDGHAYGVDICYEDLFPELSRQYTRMGASFLVNITNDAWYGDSSQLDQHLNFSRFRAVENRRALIRATNNGTTAAIDPTGKIRAEIPKFHLAVLLAEIPLSTRFSLYTRLGDGLWLGALGIAFVSAALIEMRRKKKAPV